MYLKSNRINFYLKKKKDKKNENEGILKKNLENPFFFY